MISQPMTAGCSMTKRPAPANRALTTVAATVVGALFAGAGRFVVEQPTVVGWLIVLAGFVFLWGGVFQRLLAQPAAVESRN